jgi:DDHD domain
LECGRKTVDLSTNTIRSNFIPRGPVEVLCSAIWFKRREEKNNKEIILLPIADDFDTVQIETLYQKAVEASSTFGKGLDQTLLDEKHLFKDGVTKVRLSKTGETLSVRLVPPGNWLFTSEMTLQRGYGNYTAPGEDVELALGPVAHVMFVVHGIGEALFSRNEVQVMGLIEQTQAARMEIQQRQYDLYQQQLAKANKNNNKKKSGTTTAAPLTLPPPPNRIEIIPIEWFSKVHDDSNDLMKSLRATTLTTIPALRAIANDVVFDILMYLTPAFCQQVLETVTQQINEMYDIFSTVHPQFRNNGGTITLAGHSLGSVICWDLLAILKDHLEQQGSNSSTSTASTTNATHGASAFAKGGWGPPISVAHHLPFQPDQTILLGSPLGMFLTLRGAHPALAALRKDNNGNLISPFSLPTKSLYNIFHPR